jgi:hypothetical protein
MLELLVGRQELHQSTPGMHVADVRHGTSTREDLARWFESFARELAHQEKAGPRIRAGLIKHFDQEII